MHDSDYVLGPKVMMTLKIKYILQSFKMLTQLYPVLNVVACCYNANYDAGGEGNILKYCTSLPFYR